ncbi:Glycine/D-amino acid oxidase [Sulfitobacter marinus]|uniref:Glycine/D-amino acid oxidase n=1 Tax=Sulfitobacter marinus TaxID=394264 RepID=A0A1I6VD43_9RHOB|nr:FAD-dependent oxidoreductase [Sulfitobacter marinus]SFT11673.1 Glycine/D-amino acid oxidase [Sulfitobacter marinus]
MSKQVKADYLIIGGGFYGCCLALYLRSISDRVILVEAGDTLLDRASRVNQARVHTGFHYPRSPLTAVKSMLLHQRFVADFPEAVVGDFQMLYAIARRRSKVSSKRFYRMFRDMGAPIRPALRGQAALFNPEMVEGVFAATEAAFDYSVLRRQLAQRLHEVGVDVRNSTELTGLDDHRNGVEAALSDGTTVTARYAFNVTYAQINDVLQRANLPQAQVKHELAEIALVEPPEELVGLGVTVMDGPFFSCMPYPADGLYSLTHVRYTPHDSWTDRPGAPSAYQRFASATPESRAQFMIRDGQRYLPCLERAVPHRSLFDVKTVLTKNERDDGRPILYQQKPTGSHVISILGGKIDNIYDLFDLVRETNLEFATADMRLLLGNPA